MPTRAASPLEAQKLGISTVYQEVNLCPNLSVAENMFAGRYPRCGMAHGFRIDWAEVNRRAKALLARIGLDIEGVRHWRAYSLTSDPLRRDGMIAITVKHVETGRVSPYLVRRGRPGTIVSLGGVEGDFRLPERVPARLLVAGSRRRGTRTVAAGSPPRIREFRVRHDAAFQSRHAFNLDTAFFGRWRGRSRPRSWSGRGHSSRQVKTSAGLPGCPTLVPRRQ